MKPEGLRFKHQSRLVPLGSRKSCKKVCEQNGEPENVDLFGLTKSVHTQLPRELRDIIYGYLLGPRDILLLASGTSTRLDRFPYAPGDEPTEYKTHTSPIPLPPYTNPKTSYPGFASEVFEFVYEQHPGLWIDMPSAIPTFLDFDFFGTGIKPRHARLKKLHISGSLDPGSGNAINITTLASDLRSLFDISLARGFSVDIVFRTELGVSHFYRSMLAPLASAMAQVANITKLFIAELEERGGNAHFLMLTKHKMYVYATGAESTNGGSEMYETQEQWYEDLDRNLGHICYGPYNAWVAEREVARLRPDGRRTQRWWKRGLCFR